MGCMSFKVVVEHLIPILIIWLYFSGYCKINHCVQMSPFDSHREYIQKQFPFLDRRESITGQRIYRPYKTVWIAFWISFNSCCFPYKNDSDIFVTSQLVPLHLSTPKWYLNKLFCSRSTLDICYAKHGSELWVDIR